MGKRVGMWINDGEDSEKGFIKNGKPVAFVDIGSAENARKLFELTDDEMAALKKYGDIDKDVDGVTITIEW